MTTSPKNSERVRKVVDVAAHLFANQGYHGTNTREIAQLAGVSENTLFRYFSSKEDLFWAALNSQIAGFELGGKLITGELADADPQTVLPLILARMMDAVILQPELLHLLAIAFIELPSKAEAFFAEHLLPSFVALKLYLTANIEKKKLRAIDSSLLTVALSSVLVHAELGRLIGGTPPYANRREAIRTFTTFWLELLVPSPAETGNVALSRTP